MFTSVKMPDSVNFKVKFAQDMIDMGYCTKQDIEAAMKAPLEELFPATPVPGYVSITTQPPGYSDFTPTSDTQQTPERASVCSALLNATYATGTIAVLCGAGLGGLSVVYTLIPPEVQRTIQSVSPGLDSFMVQTASAIEEGYKCLANLASQLHP
jgi:hypothetical protein